MIIIDCEQGTADWFSARLGLPTASEFHKIMTPKTMELSAQWKGYAYRLLAERLLRQTTVSFNETEYMERGKLLEPQARGQFELAHDVSLRRIGFATTDDGRYGCSPDAMNEALTYTVEFKCLAPANHLALWYEGFEDDFMVQAQGQMLVTGATACYRYGFCPQFPKVEHRTERDDAYIGRLAELLDEFCGNLDDMERKIRAGGFVEPRHEEVLTPREKWAMDLVARGLTPMNSG